MAERQRPEAPEVIEYFLGVCELSTVKKWTLCNAVLENLRQKDCSFDNTTGLTSARVHRRLCDIPNIAFYGESCNCGLTLADRNLYPVQGKYCFIKTV